jgi:serine/threonine-protein kinase
MDLLGQTIGQYQLVELIHQGENVVYKGLDSRLNRNVAVKVLSPARAGNQAFVQQFQQDMQLISGLEWRSIMPPAEPNSSSVPLPRLWITCIAGAS